MKKKRIFDQIVVFWKSNFLHISVVLFSYKLMVLPAIKAPLLRRILRRIFAFSAGFFYFAVKKKRIFDQIVVFWKSNFLHISVVLFSYKQMVVPAIKAPLLRRILRRIFAFLAGFFILL